MSQITAQEFLTKPLRVHNFLNDITPHDVWVVDLPAVTGKATLQEFRRRTKSRNLVAKTSLSVRALFGLRFFLGRVFGWDREPERSEPAYFAERLTAEDRQRSILPAGTAEKFFRVVYSFENEALLEVINRTVHAALLTALVETAHGYRFYFAVYVRELSWLSRAYMRLIDPFRRWLVYPAILKQIQREWVEVFRRDVAEGPGITER
jgi:Protein of unknown function (DUF2867)